RLLPGDRSGSGSGRRLAFSWGGARAFLFLTGKMRPGGGFRKHPPRQADRVLKRRRGPLLCGPVRPGRGSFRAGDKTRHEPERDNTMTHSDKTMTQNHPFALQPAAPAELEKVEGGFAFADILFFLGGLNPIVGVAGIALGLGILIVGDLLSNR